MKISNLGGETSPFYNAYHQGVFITKNHNVWSDGKWKPAGEVKTVCVVNLGMNNTQIKVMCFQKLTTEVECHLFPSLQCTYYYHLKVHTINLISLRLLILITWLRYCLSSFCFVVIIFSPFSKCSLWKETTVPGRHLQRGNLCPIFFKLSMYIIYLECCK